MPITNCPHCVKYLDWQDDAECTRSGWILEDEEEAMNKVVKGEGFGNFRVLNERGQLVGTFFFSRSKTRGQVVSTCRVKPRDGAEFKTSHCYFADVRRDAMSGSLFS